MLLVKIFHCINQNFIVTNTAEYLYLLIVINVIIVSPETSEKNNSQRKSNNLLVPAKLNAPIKFTSPERFKINNPKL